MTDDREDLSDDELRELAVQKNRKGSFTKVAMSAQYILWKRAGCPFTNSYSWERDHTIIRKF